MVDIFNRVNSGGTKLSKGDLALAKICADWPEGRDAMKAKLKEWTKADYHFTLDWLLRSVNTVLTGEAKFQHLHEKTAAEVQEALARTAKHIETSLNLIGGRLGLDHDQVFFGRFGVPVMARYLDQRQAKKLGPMGEQERDKLLFWFVQAAMWGRFSGSTESFIDQDLAALEGADGGLDKLLEQLRLWHGGLRAEPGHFTGWSLGARFYPVLYLLTRMGGSRDWGTGLPLKASLLGQDEPIGGASHLPQGPALQTYYKRPEVNALANFCFLTKDTNLHITDRLPEDYFPEVETAHKGALASQWIPDDPALWKIDTIPRLPRGPQGVAGGGTEPPHGGTASRRRPLAGRRGRGDAGCGSHRQRNQQRRGRGQAGGAERLDGVAGTAARGGRPTTSPTRSPVSSKQCSIWRGPVGSRKN